jgi:uncharacterized protein involved in copper resistance
MLRVTTARRLLATVLAPWLVLFLTMPGAVHTCAMHSVTGAAHVHGVATSQPSGDHAMAGHDMGAHDMAGTAMSGMSHDAVNIDASSAPAPDAPVCSCPEGCCTVTVVSAEVPATLSWVRELLAHDEPAFPRTLGSVALATDVRLPFANGPPAQG